MRYRRQLLPAQCEEDVQAIVVSDDNDVGFNGDSWTEECCHRLLYHQPVRHSPSVLPPRSDARPGGWSRCGPRTCDTTTYHLHARQ